MTTATIPRDAITPTLTATYLAVLTVYAVDGRCTVRSVMDELGLRSTSSAHRRLNRLRSAGLVAWDQGRTGTLRPLYGLVPRVA